MFRLVYPELVERLNMTRKVFVIPSLSRNLRYKEEMFRLVYPEPVEGLNITENVFVIPSLSRNLYENKRCFDSTLLCSTLQRTCLSFRYFDKLSRGISMKTKDIST